MYLCFMKKPASVFFTVLLALLFFSQLGFPVTADAQPPVPVLNCISAEDDGSLTVSWSIPAGTFDGFRLFYKKTTDPLSNSIDLTNVTTSTNIPVADGLTAGYEVYLTTIVYGPPVQLSAESNHLRSMKLTVSNAGAGSGIARLDWNRVEAGSNGVFNIYRRELTGTFSQIGQTTGIFYQDTITSPYCKSGSAGTDLYYQVEFSSASCVSRSTVASGNFFDDNLPEDPVLSFVTVGASGLAEVHWTHSPSADVGGYVVGVKIGLNYIDHAETGYTDVFTDDQISLPTYYNPCYDSVIYVLRAKDLCDNQSSGAINYQFPHNTIHLSGETQTLCDRKASLAWNAYRNMQPAVNSYRILRTHNGAAPVVLATVAATTADYYTYIDDELLTPGDVYTYRIESDNGNNSMISSSCEIQLVPDPEPLTTFSLDYLTVTNNELIDLTVSSDSPHLISEIELWRTETPGSPASKISTYAWEAMSPELFSDVTALVNETSYYYYVVALDACGFELEASNTARSIYLQISDLGNDEFRLSWNSYEDWGANLLEYSIYRIADGVVEPGWPVTVPPTVNTFNDIAGDLTANRTTYYVDAVRNDDVTSRSNEVLLPAEASLMVPNAFRPDGISPVFRPRVRNIEQGSYLFAIYNRWGQLVFETNNLSEGWNGLSGGVQSAADIYAWVVKFNDLHGNQVARRGSVILLR